MIGQHAAFGKSGRNQPCNLAITFIFEYFVYNFIKIRMVHTVLIHVEKAPNKF